MKRVLMTIMTAAVLGLAGVGAGAETISGAAQDEYVTTYDFGSFTSLSIGEVMPLPGANRHINFHSIGSMTVILVESDSYKVELRVNRSEYVGFFSVGIRDGMLCIGQAHGNDNPSPAPVATVTVYAPSFDDLLLDGVCNVNAQGAFSGENVKVRIEGINTLSGLSLKAKSVELSLGGVSVLKDCGIVAKDRLDLETDGSVEVSGLSMDSKEVEMKTQGYVIMQGVDIRCDSLKIRNKDYLELRKGSASVGGAQVVLLGANRLSFDSFSAGNLTVKASGATEFRVGGGETDYLELSMSQSSKFDLKEMKCKDVKAEIDGSSSAAVYATESIRYNLKSYVARLDYYGNPKSVVGKSPEARER